MAAEVERIEAAAGRAGVAPADIQVRPQEDFTWGLVGVNPGDVLMAMEEGDGARARSAGATVRIKLPNVAAYERLRDAVETAETSVGPVEYSLSDPAGAQREARADAVLRARAEAEDYARTIGMRVGRLVRVSARGDAEALAVMEMLRVVNRADVPPDVVETKFRLAADFALVPTR